MSMNYVCLTDTLLHVEETEALSSLINILFNL